MTSDDSTQRILDAVARLEAGQTSLRAEFLAELGSTRAAIMTIMDLVGRLEDRIGRLEAGQTSLRTDQISLRADFLAELGGTRAAIMDRINRLENRITEIRDDIEVAMGSTEAAQRVNDNTRADLRTLGEQVSVMWKQIKRLEGRIRDITGDP